MKNNIPSLKASLAMILAVSLAALPLTRGGTFNWTGAGSDNYWSNPDNWDDGAAVPETEDDVAVFALDTEEPYTVTFDRDNVYDTFNVGANHVVFDLNGFTNMALVNNPALCGSANMTGSVLVVNGRFGWNYGKALSVGAGSGARATFAASGSGTFIEGGNLQPGRSAGAYGEVLILDGAEATFNIPWIANGGTGRLVVSNASVYAKGGLNVGITATSDGGVLVSGESGYAKFGGTVTIGVGGVGSFRVEKGAETDFNKLVVGKDLASTGTVTVAGTGSSLGTEQAGFGSLTLGSVANLAVGGELPGLGGTGMLEILDGAVVLGQGASQSRQYVFINEGCRIKIRDGSLQWCAAGSYRYQPIYFKSGSFYTVELTERTAASIAELGSLIHAGANEAGEAGLNKIEGAILEIALADGFAPAPGTEYAIFRYDGELEGTFAGLPEGAEFYAGGWRFRINYGERSLEGREEPGEITLTTLPPLGSVLVIR